MVGGFGWGPNLLSPQTNTIPLYWEQRARQGARPRFGLATRPSSRNPTATTSAPRASTNTTIYCFTVLPLCILFMPPPPRVISAWLGDIATATAVSEREHSAIRASSPSARQKQRPHVQEPQS